MSPGDRTAPIEVLVVEDDDDHAELLTRALEGEEQNYRVFLASSLVEARQLLKDRVPDVVLVDYVLPDGSGTELLAAERRCPCILITGHGDEDVATAAFKEGASDYIRKSGSGMLTVGRVIERVISNWRLASAEKRHLEEISDLNRQFKAVLESVTMIGVVSVDSKGIIKLFNRGAERLFGWSSDELVEKENVIKLLVSDETDFATFIRTAQESNSIAATRANGTGLTRDGRQFPVSAASSQIRSSSGDVVGYVLAFADMSARAEAERARAELERQLAQAQKEEALSLLAAGIAHDFNNALAAMVSSANLIGIELRQRGDVERASELAADIVTAGKQAGALVRRVLAVSRPAASHRGRCAPDVAVRHCMDLLHPSIGSSIETRVNLPDHVPDVAISPLSLQHVLLNLLINANHALTDGGTITVSAETPVLSTRKCASCQMEFRGEYLSLTVHDSGTGIPPSLRERVFEPFFSTRGEAAGSGLGLAMVHKILHAVAGHICLSDDGGTKFELFLPLADGPREEDDETQERPLLPRLRVLLVEDEQLVRAATEAILSRLGCTVTAVDSGEAALEAFAAAPDNFDMLLTDQKLPGRQGSEVAQTLLAHREHLPLVIVSGNIETPIDSLREERVVLQKPFTVDELVDAMTQALERARA